MRCIAARPQASRLRPISGLSAGIRRGASRRQPFDVPTARVTSVAQPVVEMVRTTLQELDLVGGHDIAAPARGTADRDALGCNKGLAQALLEHPRSDGSVPARNRHAAPSTAITAWEEQAATLTCAESRSRRSGRVDSLTQRCRHARGHGSTRWTDTYITDTAHPQVSGHSTGGLTTSPTVGGRRRDALQRGDDADAGPPCRRLKIRGSGRDVVLLGDCLGG